MTNEPNLTNEERADLVAYLDGELDERAASRLESKLGRDPRARAEVNELKRVWECLDQLPRPTPSPDFTQQTMERLTVVSAAQPPAASVSARWRPLILPIGWAAAALLAIGIGFAGTRLLSPPKEAAETVVAPEIDTETLARDRRVIENRRLYEHAVNIDFLRALANPDDPDLFGDDSSGS